MKKSNVIKEIKNNFPIKKKLFLQRLFSIRKLFLTFLSIMLLIIIKKFARKYFKTYEKFSDIKISIL